MGLPERKRVVEDDAGYEKGQTNAPETSKTPDDSQRGMGSTPVVEVDNAEPEREKSAAKGPPAKRIRSSERSDLIISLKKMRDELKKQLEAKRRKKVEERKEFEALQKQIEGLRRELAED